METALRLAHRADWNWSSSKTPRDLVRSCFKCLDEGGNSDSELSKEVKESHDKVTDSLVVACFETCMRSKELHCLGVER